MQAGHIGVSPVPKNSHKRKIPVALIDATASYARMKQLNGDEQKPRQLKRVMLAAVRGTAYEQHLSSEESRRRLLRSMRERHPDLSREGPCEVDGFCVAMHLASQSKMGEVLPSCVL